MQEKHSAKGHQFRQMHEEDINTIHMYSGIKGGGVLDGELLLESLCKEDIIKSLNVRLYSCEYQWALN